MNNYQKIVVLFALGLTASGVRLQASPAKTAQKIEAKKAAKPKSNIAGVDVTGLNASEKSRRITRVLKPRLRVRIKLTDGKKSFVRTREQLGISLDVASMVKQSQSAKSFVPLKLKSEPLRMQIVLRRLAPRFKSAGSDARLVERGSGVRIIKDQPSRELNVGESATRAAQEVNKNASLRVLKLVSKTTPRTLTAARFKGIDARIGTYTTEFNASNAKRTQNMRIAIRAIDGTFVQPGKVFSLNDTVGERTQKRGYRTSIIFLNGYKVPGVGAGVSQVTGTLFNAALLAGLPIVEVRFHSQPVAYIPVGRDATVAWGGFDMKFKNNTPAPLYITYKVRGDSVRATIFGKRVKGRKVSISVRKQSKGPRHITSQTYRTIRQGGKVVSKQLIRKHVYKWNKGKWEDG